MSTDTIEREDILNARTLLVAMGVVGVAIGVLMLVWPEITLVVAAVLLGSNFLLFGTLTTVAALTQELDVGERVLLVVLGLLSILAGIIVFARPAQTLATLVIVFGAISVVTGIVDLVRGVTRHGGMDGLMVLSGIVSVVFGVMLIAWPGPTVIVLVRVIALWLLVFGVIRVVIGWRLPKAVEES